MCEQQFQAEVMAEAVQAEQYEQAEQFSLAEHIFQLGCMLNRVRAEEFRSTEQ